MASPKTGLPLPTWGQWGRGFSQRFLATTRIRWRPRQHFQLPKLLAAKFQRSFPIQILMLTFCQNYRSSAAVSLSLLHISIVFYCVRTAFWALTELSPCVGNLGGRRRRGDLTIRLFLQLPHFHRLFKPYPWRASSSAGLWKSDVFIRKIILEAAKLYVNRKDCSANEEVIQDSEINRHLLRFQWPRMPWNTTVLHRKKKDTFSLKQLVGVFSLPNGQNITLRKRGKWDPF